MFISENDARLTARKSFITYNMFKHNVLYFVIIFLIVMEQFKKEWLQILKKSEVCLRFLQMSIQFVFTTVENSGLCIQQYIPLPFALHPQSR